jgi:N-acetyl sugar amidotransferase
MSDLKKCTFCLLDETCFELKLDINGRCHVCLSAEKELEHDLRFQGKVDTLASEIKDKRLNSQYDALIGLSGGVDSAYLAHLAVKDMGLNVLAVHVDTGWNSVPAVRNINRIVKRLDLDLITHVVDWQEMKELQLAFLRSGVVNQDLPQDHSFFAVLYKIARKQNVKYFLNGVNATSECVRTPSMGPTYLDLRHIKAILASKSKMKLNKYPKLNLFSYLVFNNLLKQPIVVKPLNYIDYDKNTAQNFLRLNYSWEDYGEKHSESGFTKFYQEVYLPRKYHFDKQRVHLSSQIVSGQITRTQALSVLGEHGNDSNREAINIRYVAKKLEIEESELTEILDTKGQSHYEFSNNEWLWEILVKLKKIFQRMRLLWK